jgi:hypothetical protein
MDLLTKSFKKTDKIGYLYIIINPAYPDWVKVGTTLNLENRLHTYQTGSPFRDYKILYSLYHPEYLQAEKRIKETMRYFAKSIRNEWYEVDIHIAKTRLEEQLDEYNEFGCKKSLD